MVMLAAVAAMAAPPQIVVFTDEAGATTAQTRTVSAGAIGASAGTTAAVGAVREAFALRSPDRSTVAVGLLDASGNLTVRPFTDGGFGASVTVAAGVPPTRPAPVAAAYQSRSGRLVIVYAVNGSNDCLVRTYDGAVSGATTVPLSLSSAPTRITVAPSPASDEVLIVAHDGSQRLSATVWDGASFRATELVDSSYDGGSNRWDAAWPRTGGPMVAWARTSDTTLRVRRLDGSTWASMDSTPVAPGVIGRIALAADHARGAVGVAAGIVSGTGRLEVSTLEAGAWTMPTLMTTALNTAGDRPLGLAYEGSGGGLVCAWLDEGSDRFHVRRRSGSAWDSGTTSAVIGSGLTELLTGPDEDDAGVVVLARTVSGGGSGGGSGLGEYVVYAQNGTIHRGDRTVFNGLHGSKVNGVSLPAAPEGSNGSTNITLNHDQTQTLQPGSYRDLSFGDRTQIRLSAGTYIFRKLSNSGHDARFVCDTSAGNVVVVFRQAQTQFRDRFRVERNGAGSVSVHSVGGSFKIGHDSDIEAVLVSHSGAMHFGDRTHVTGHVFGHSTIHIGHDSVLGLPSWSLPQHLGGSAQASHRIYGAAVVQGVPGSVTQLTTSAIQGSTPPALAVSAPPIQSSTRVVRWREVERQ